MNEECFAHLKHTNMLTKRPTLLGCFHFEMQLSPIAPEKWNIPESCQWMRTSELMLSDAAFLPRQFTVVVERGNFGAINHEAGRRVLRMTFDTSSYPTADGYNHNPRSGPPWDSLHEWLGQERSLYAGKPSDELLKTRATDDDTILGYHTSSCVVM
jgi:hypothetical protein